MKFGRENPGASEAETQVTSSLTSSQEMREMAEALSLYRSAMQHVAEKQAARPFVPAAQRAAGVRMRLVLVPALGAALAAAVIAPAYMHLHKTTMAGAPAHPTVQTASTAAQPVMDDSDLMNQIDSEVSEDVPDALQPLEDLSEQSATAATTTNSEKNEHATQK